MKKRCRVYDFSFSIACWYFEDVLTHKVYRLYGNEIQWVKNWSDLEQVPFVGF